MDAEVSRRMWIARYIMICGIVILHVPPHVPLAEMGRSPFEILKAFFSHGLFRATVPVLTAISGYILFHSGLDRSLVAVFRKKFRTIVLPLVIWNLPFALAVYFLQRSEALAHPFSVNLYPFEWGRWLDAVVGLFNNPVNYPLNFLRDLFAVSLLAPLMGLFLRREGNAKAWWAYGGLALFAVAYVFNWDRLYLLRTSMLLTFYLGGLARTRNWDLIALDRFAVPLALVLFAFCIVVGVLDLPPAFGLNTPNREWLRLSSPFLVWPALSLISKNAIGDWVNARARNSFVIFLSHGPVLLATWLAYKVINDRFPLPYELYWLLAPLVTIFISERFGLFLRARVPNWADIALGGR